MDGRFELYGITDQKSARGRGDLEVARSLIAGGVSCLQYRAKAVEEGLRRQCAFELRGLCKRNGLPFIVNDFLDLALDCQADGLHLGQDDISLGEARERAEGRLFLGRSTHSLEQALAAQAQGADYIGYGPLFPTETKEKNIAAVGLQELPQLLKFIQIPVVAIGGIKSRHLGELAKLGCEHIAVVTALTGAEDVEKATRSLFETWKHEKEGFSRRDEGPRLI